jgi:hypothetical protein
MASRFVVAIALGVLVLAASPAQAAVDPGDTCKERKAKAAGKKVFELLKAFGENIERENLTKLGSDISKAQSKFTRSFTKAEGSNWIQCLTSGDSDAIEAKVDVLVEDVVAEVSFRFADNGDGTITDKKTGLMWEQKDSADGTPNPDNLHDVDNRYSWAGCCDGDCTSKKLCQRNAAAAAACGGAVGCSECLVGTCETLGDGTIWEWIVQVNDEGGLGFAGHSDWRIPSEDGCNVCYTKYHPNPMCPCDPSELESILLRPYRCDVDPCIDPIFGPTASSWHWSASTSYNYPRGAWEVNFGSGAVESVSKYWHDPVRAVRGGSPSGAFLDVTTGVLD